MSVLELTRLRSESGYSPDYAYTLAEKYASQIEQLTWQCASVLPALVSGQDRPVGDLRRAATRLQLVASVLLEMAEDAAKQHPERAQ